MGDMGRTEDESGMGAVDGGRVLGDPSRGQGGDLGPRGRELGRTGPTALWEAPGRGALSFPVFPV